jgi:hypothetical protein
MFLIIVRIVRGLYGFVEPFCFHSDIKKAIVIYFTSMHFVNSTSYLLYYLGCPRMLCLATLSKVFQLWRVECQWISSACLLVMSETLYSIEVQSGIL